MTPKQQAVIEAAKRLRDQMSEAELVLVRQRDQIKSSASYHWELNHETVLNFADAIDALAEQEKADGEAD